MIPNVFTPNGDDKNETFEIVNILPKTQLIVLDRNGIVIFKSDDYDNSWNAQNVVGGTYYYYLNNRFYNNEYRGYVQVIK